MATLPSASTTITETAGAPSTGVDILTIIAAVPTAADAVPRLYGNAAAILAKHGYAAAIDYAAMHIAETRKPVLFVGLPIVTAGAIGSQSNAGNTGTSAVTIAAGADGVLEETDGILKVATGGTVGTDQIRLSLSCDGGRTYKPVRLGTATSYTIPYVGLVVSFVSGGTLVAGDTILTWHSSAPRWDQAGIESARTALAAQAKLSRGWLVDGDLLTEQDAVDVQTEIDLYEPTHKRFQSARCQVSDMRRAGAKSRLHVAMTGAPSITFAEVGGTGDTITRATGSFITDGFAVGDVITVSGAVAGSGANNVTGPIASLSATVITLGTTDLQNEGPITGVSIVASKPLVFAEVGATGDTITRAGGSWIADGFAVGDTVTITGTASNNVSGVIAALSATVLTFDTTDLTAETIGTHSVTITSPAESKSDAVARNDGLFADIDAAKRIELCHGRARKRSPITGWLLRRPAAWAVTIREYQHDVQIPTFRKADGPLMGWDLEDADGTRVEHDETVDSGALAARFTCLRTWSNGPAGAFVALALTRDTDDATLSRAQNMAVANVGCTTVQAAAENAVGQVLTRNADGTGTEDALQRIEESVNTALATALLSDKGEGPRSTYAKWTASRNDDLSVPGATLTGVLELELNGTIEQIATTVAVS